MQGFANVIGSIFNILLPPRCPATGDIVGRQGALSPEAWSKLTFIGSPLCGICGMPFPFQDDTVDGMQCEACLSRPPRFDTARAALAYDDGSRGLILKFKHGDQTHVLKCFLPWIVRTGQDMLQDVDMIAPVPLHRWRLLKRRYNQAALLALALGRQTARPAAPALLRRVRATLPQGHDRAGSRRANVRNAFEVDRRFDVRGKRIVLVDDVLTTGATVDECARVLKRAGAARVDVLALARVVKGG